MTDVAEILVTGGAGYIGSLLVDRLRAKGRSVRVLDLKSTGRPGDQRGDIRDAPLLADALRGIDTVVHLAALSGDSAADLDPKLTHSVNVEATQSLLELAAEAGVAKLIFASSCSVYGANDDLVSETTPPNPLTRYAESKLLAEQQVLADWGEMEIHVLRFGTGFGVAPQMRFDLVVNRLSGLAARGQPITIYGGEQWRPFVSVADMATATEAVIDTERELPGILNVGFNAQNLQLRDLAAALLARLPEAEVSIDSSKVDQRNYRVDFSRFQNELRSRSSTNLDQGIDDLVGVLARNATLDPLAPEFQSLTTARQLKQDQ